MKPQPVSRTIDADGGGAALAAQDEALVLGKLPNNHTDAAQ